MPTDPTTPPILPAAAVAAMVERAEKATPGPWSPYRHEADALVGPDGNESLLTVDEEGFAKFGRVEDCDFAAHARADLPALAASHEALRAEVETLRSTKGSAADWQADHQRTALESVGLAEEFPFGCDAIQHVAEALVSSRAEVERLRDCERVAWCMERGFRFLCEVKGSDPEGDTAAHLSRTYAPFIVLLEASEIDGFGWLLQLKDKNMIQDTLQVLMRHMDRAEIDAARKGADDAR